MYKDLVVNLSVRKNAASGRDYALSIASAFDAHITGVAFAFVPNIPGASMGYLPLETIETQQRDNERDAETAVSEFTSAATAAGVIAETRIVRSSLDDAADNFSLFARRFDLAIVGQTNPSQNSVNGMISESTLFESGRPIIVVPYIQRAPLRLDRVMICWDGSRAAVRAIADAAPFLDRASAIEVVTVSDDHRKRNNIQGADIGLHLARHGYKIDVNQLSRGDMDIADVLLSHAADSGADLIVMGGYGHSRMREFLLGGVTRSIFQSMTVPTLMSH